MNLIPFYHLARRPYTAPPTPTQSQYTLSVKEENNETDVVTLNFGRIVTGTGPRTVGILRVDNEADIVYLDIIPVAI